MVVMRGPLGLRAAWTAVGANPSASATSCTWTPRSGNDGGSASGRTVAAKPPPQPTPTPYLRRSGDLSAPRRRSTTRRGKDVRSGRVVQREPAPAARRRERHQRVRRSSAVLRRPAPRAVVARRERGDREAVGQRRRDDFGLLRQAPARVAARRPGEPAPGGPACGRLFRFRPRERRFGSFLQRRSPLEACSNNKSPARPRAASVEQREEARRRFFSGRRPDDLDVLHDFERPDRSRRRRAGADGERREDAEL